MKLGRHRHSPAMPGGGIRGTPWYLTGGIPLTNCIAAYQPRGATSLESSYINLANPGTFDLTPGIAPTWDAANGWKGNGSTQYLRTGIVPETGWSVVVSFYNAGVGANFVFGGDDGVNARFLVIPNYSSKVYYANGQVLSVSPALTSGIIGISGDKGYRNGVADAGTIGAWSGTSYEIYLMASNSSGSPSNYFGGYVQAIAIYNTVLTDNQMLAINNAIRLIAPPTWLLNITYSSSIGT